MSFRLPASLYQDFKMMLISGHILSFAGKSLLGKMNRLFCMTQQPVPTKQVAKTTGNAE